MLFRSPVGVESVEPGEFAGMKQSDITDEDIDNMRRMYQGMKPGKDKDRMGKMLADAIKSRIKKKPFDPSAGIQELQPADSAQTLGDLRGRKEERARVDRGRPYSVVKEDSTSPGTVVRSVPRDARVDIAIRTDNSSNFMLQSMRTSGSIFGGGTGY